MSKPVSILFVCLGNICRSPLAEGALRAAAAAAGRDLVVDSAGTGDWHVGRPPDPRAQAVAKAHGVDIAGLRARQVTPDDFRRFTHVYALDPVNFADLAAIRPADATAELALLMDVVPGREGTAVVDPYYGDATGFEITWADVTTAAARLIDRLGG
ncbi:low molecular weight protein-tyrosine-phosphatase [Hephaestia sp. GCM10023244]|uniref:low molecular weight protein-tyrosine-phosphatase n=1 Tax=unclassified Hephaestia TaxID=2631281 RepID=UPI002077640B|nr:low molecular weight protein-tyrosine-phosphatase [Hephaestia sp. MAHUQ-44]MCM8730744.1 low molecular weight phosphotyrosine protein phosphatase [Hephaestia sp. MAHUQ-44]